MESNKPCENCGTMMVDRSPAQNRRHCSKRCISATRYKDPKYREECQARSKAHYWADPEADRALSKAWREANPERKRASDRAWADANRERKHAKDRAYYQANKAKAHAYAKARIAANPEKHREYDRTWRRRNPEKVRELSREMKDRRRARLQGAFVAKVNRADIYARDGYTCQLCGRKVNMNLVYPHPKSASLDHILPLSKGGTHEPKNVQLAHRICNMRKKNTGADQLRLFGE